MEPPVNTVQHDVFSAPSLAFAKGGLRVTVGLPARDEAATVGTIVDVIRRELVDQTGLVDEILVLDDHSTDDTGRVAAEAGARVIRAEDVLPAAAGHGKGEALWRLTYAASGDLVVFCDADIVDFGPRFVVGLLGPLLNDPDAAFVKGFYARPGENGDNDGGRVTEVLARPLLATLFPHLGGIVQPLSGEYAARRSLLEQLPFARGYGVDLGLLIDAAASVGTQHIVQVDLGTRRHRNRPLDELGAQAFTVLQTGLARAGVPTANPATLRRPGQPPLEAALDPLPPLAMLGLGEHAAS